MAQGQTYLDCRGLASLCTNGHGKTVKVSTVYQWRKRGLLPEPDFEAGKSPMWERRKILQWAKDTGRLKSAS